MLRAIAKMLAPLERRLNVMVTRAVVTMVDDTQRTQNLQVTVFANGVATEVYDGVEHFQPVGFTSVPLVGAEAMLGAVCGNADHRIAAVVHDKRSRPRKLKQGETMIYSPLTGDRIWLHADGTMTIQASGKVKLIAPAGVEIDGNLVVRGNVSDATGSMALMRQQHNTHNHPPTATTPPSVLMT